MKKRDLTAKIPDNPGVYLMLNAVRKIIYIGKASNLRKRVSSYFTKDYSFNERTARMMSKVHKIEFIVTQSEIDALVLEQTLIKQHKPAYNVKLMDDKTFPYIKVTISEKFPRIFPTRTIKGNGALYLGPYTDVRAVKKTIKTGRKLFPLRNCGKKLPGKDCLDYHIGLCSAPCISKISSEEYRIIVNNFIKFLEGKQNEVERQLEKSMKNHSNNLEFEKASEIRDRLLALEKIKNRQKVVLSKKENMDVIGLAREKNDFCIVVEEVRDAKLVYQYHYFMNGLSDNNSAIETFLSNYYREKTYIPKQIILAQMPSSKKLLESWLSKKAQYLVTLKKNVKKEKLSILKMANKNAQVFIAELLSVRKRKQISQEVKELGRVLKLKTLPVRMEAFDISNIMGKFAVGSSVLFVNALPVKSGYLQYRIRSVKEINDVAMMKEIINRRLNRIIKKKDKKPDLLIVDGGLAQLNAAISLLKVKNIHIPVIGLAKRFENIYLGRNKIVSLSVDSPALKLLKRIRDESHRFAINYYRKLHKKSLRESVLDNLEGIGKIKKKRLLRHFGSLKKLKEASVKEIEEVQGFGKNTALAVFEYLRNKYNEFTAEKT